MFKTADTHNIDLPRKLQLGKSKIPRGDSYFRRAEELLQPELLGKFRTVELLKLRLVSWASKAAGVR